MFFYQPPSIFKEYIKLLQQIFDTPQVMPVSRLQCVCVCVLGKGLDLGKKEYMFSCLCVMLSFLHVYKRQDTLGGDVYTNLVGNNFQR